MTTHKQDFIEDLDVFFDPENPGIEPVIYLDDDSVSQTVFAKYLTKDEEHASGPRHISQTNPAIELPDEVAKPLIKGKHVDINSLQLEVVEVSEKNTTITRLYLAPINTEEGPDSPTGGHRWGISS